jgi:hypothetical protein
MIGNKPFIADLEILKGNDSELKAALSEIGWMSGEKDMGQGKAKGKGKDWKPKFAVVKRREVSEVERALEAVKK